MPELDRARWTEPMLAAAAAGVLLGVYTGGCVLRGDGSRFRAKAHAHDVANKDRHGWLCFLSASRLESQELVLHELAHLYAPGGHTDGWRAKLVEIGGTLDAVPGLLKDYHKRTRPRPVAGATA